MLSYSERSDDIDDEGYVFWDMMAFGLIEFTGVSNVGVSSVFRREERIFTTKYSGIRNNACSCPPTRLIFILHQSNI